MTAPAGPGPVHLPDELRIAFRGLVARRALLDADEAEFARDRAALLAMTARRAGLASVAEMAAAYDLDATAGVLHPKPPARPAEATNADDRPQD